MRRARLHLALLLALLAPTASAAPAVEPPEGATELVLRYSEGFGEARTAERLVVEVWGDGRVVVQRPAFVQGSPRSQATMSRGQVRALLQQLAGHGVFEFDAPSVKASVRASARERAERGRRSPGEPALLVLSDPDPTTLEVHAASYQPEGGEPQHGVSRIIDWHGVVADAVAHPDVPALTHLREAQERVRELLALPGLR